MLINDRPKHAKPGITGLAKTSNAPPATEALAVSIAEASRISGLGRSELYRRLGRKQVCAVKSGSRTLILMESLRQHLASLPPATFRAPSNPA
jgi:hypothetical protein